MNCERCKVELTEDNSGIKDAYTVFCNPCETSYKHEMKMKEEAKEAQNKISQMLNRYGSSEVIKAFVDCESRDHRTLQQEFTKLCVAWLLHLATLPENHYDLRNAASVELAKKLLKNVDKYDLHLPLI